jgi:hypothetical protein
MPWWKLDHHFHLRSYYLGFALTVPPSGIVMVAVLKMLFRVSTANLVLSWVLFCTLMVGGGAPLLRWAHKSSFRTGSARPVIFAVELMFACGLIPFGYFLIRKNGFEPLPLFGTCSIVVIPFLLLCCCPPKQVSERVKEGLKGIAESDISS